MKMRDKLILTIICSATTLIINTALASSTSVTYPQSQDTIQQNQNLAKAQQTIAKHSAQIKQQDDESVKLQREAQANNTAQKTPTSAAPQATTTTPTKTQSIPVATVKNTCDCYTTTDAYNYSGNFLYDSNGKRISRIYPDCSCAPQTKNEAPTVTPVSGDDSQAQQNMQTSTSPVVTPNTNSPTDKQKGSSGSEWNIQY